MNAIKDISKKIEELEKIMESLKKDLTKYFLIELGNIFEKFPDLKYIDIYVSNNEFNDGDPTYFSVYYESMVIKIGETEILSAEEEDEHPIIKELVDLFKNTQKSHEFAFGDEYGSLLINKELVLEKLKKYN
jgi:hypothetical protein